MAYNWKANRGTAAGSWALVDPPGTTVRTTATGPSYPKIDSAGQAFGQQGAAGAFANATMANSGNNPLLGGRLNHNAAGNHSRHDLPGAGPYNIKLALGDVTNTNAQFAVLVTGTSGEFATAMGGSLNSFRIWQTGRTWTSSDYLVTSLNEVWDCTISGTAPGTIEPSGAGPFDDDGGARFVKIAAASALVKKVYTGSPTQSQILNQNGAITAATDWEAQSPLVIDIPSTGVSGYTLLKTANGLFFERVVGDEPIVAPLEDVVLYDEYGHDAGPTPTIFTNQPTDYRTFRLGANTGASALANFALGGPLAGFFTLALLNAQVVAIQTTRIPDALAGAGIPLQVIQTDPLSPGSPYSTPFALTLVSSQGKPTTDLSMHGKISTQNWLVEKKILDTHAAEAWTGPPAGYDYTGRTQFVNNATELRAALVAFATTSAPDGVSGYRIRCRNGSYTGSHSPSLRLNFGPTGWLAIEPDAGHDPQINCSFANIVANRVIVQDLLCPLLKSAMDGNGHQWSPADPGPGNGFYTGMIFRRIRFGLGHIGYTPQQVEAEAGSPLHAYHARQIYFEACDFWGCDLGPHLFGVRLGKVDKDCTVRMQKGDIIAYNNAFGYGSTQGVFLDNDCYYDFRALAIWDELDYPGINNSGAHKDAIQAKTYNGNMSRWYPNSGNDNDPAVPWTVGSGIPNQCLNMLATPPALYRVAGLTGATPGITGGGTGPTGTANGQVDGGVIWDYVGPYTTASKCWVAMGGIVHHSATPNSATINTTRQFFIDSNGGINCPTDVSAYNIISCTLQARGLSGANGNIFADYCTFAAANQINANTPQGNVTIIHGNGTIVSRHNVLLGAPFVEYGGKVSSQHDVIVSFAASAGVGSRPGDLLGAPGDFVQDAASGNRWGYPSFDDTEDSAAAMTMQLAGILRHKTLAAGSLLHSTALSVTRGPLRIGRQDGLGSIAWFPVPAATYAP